MSKQSNYQLVCGMEVHAELKTNSKMFCSCKNDPFGAEKPNIHTCPVCLGMPGGLPVANKKAIEWTIKLGLALGCEINLFSKFDRKHYFYPDLPKGYQISQYDIPFCVGGQVETSFGPVRITRIHLEEDTGKLLHKEVDGKKVSLIDFNRSSVPLIEIVTEPDITSPEMAAEYGRKLRQIIRYLEIGDCDMEQGGMRLEANISLQKEGATKLPNYKVEVKNINSFRFLEQAIKFEIERQGKVLVTGEIPVQETRGFNPNTGKTFSQRTKENAEDYRYFPDPDLPPVRFTKEQIADWRQELPTMPLERVLNWQQQFGVEPRYGELLFETETQAQQMEELFELAKNQDLKPNKIANLLVNKKLELGETPAATLEKFVKATATAQVDEGEVVGFVTQALEANPDAVAKYQAGQTQLLNFLLGQVMKIARKKLDPQQIKAELEKQLS